jgi:hypothetical protein
MNDKRSRICRSSIDEQNDELTITFIRPMMGTGTLGVGTASNLQIESGHNTEASAGQFFFDPCLRLFMVLIESQKG